MGPNSSLDELALVTAARFVRPGEDSLLQETFEPPYHNDTTITHGAIAPNNTREEAAPDQPEFVVDARSLQSVLSNLETMRSLESYDPESSPEVSGTTASMESISPEVPRTAAARSSASPTLQEAPHSRHPCPAAQQPSPVLSPEEAPEPARHNISVRRALETSFLLSQAESSPPSTNQGLQPITVNLYTEVSSRSKITTRHRRTRSLEPMEIDVRTMIVHLSPQPRGAKRGRDTAELSVLERTAAKESKPNPDVEEKPSSPTLPRLRPRPGRAASAQAQPETGGARARPSRPRTVRTTSQRVAKPNPGKE